MHLTVDQNTVVVFDLDDTLYKEVDFVFSAYRHISDELLPQIGFSVYKEMCEYFNSGEDIFARIKERYALEQSISELVLMYRYHPPLIVPSLGAIELLSCLTDHGAKLGVITDGRKVTQENKIVALGLWRVFDKIVISEEVGSEKPATENYAVIERAFPNCDYIYVGDNFRKDFVTPNRRDWSTIGLSNDGRNIHSQVGSFEPRYLPQHLVSTLADITVARGPTRKTH